MGSVIQLIELIRQFCELVPDDYDYEQDEFCLHSFIRNYLIQALDKWSTLELKHVRPIRGNPTLGDKLVMIGNYACLDKVSDLFLAFIAAKQGKDFKALLEMFNN